jgi:hypothetical protein
MKNLLLISAYSLVFCACVEQAKFLAPDFSVPQRIAILPTINHTIDVKGGIVFRHLFYEELNNKEYCELIDLNRIDSLLNLEGITDGGQLSTVEDTALHRILQADGLLYVTLLECEYQTLGITSNRKVKANFRLVIPDNHLIWEDEHEVEEGKSWVETFIDALDNPGKTLKKSLDDLGDQVAEKVVKTWIQEHELKDQMIQVIEKSLKTLP